MLVYGDIEHNFNFKMQLIPRESLRNKNKRQFIKEHYQGSETTDRFDKEGKQVKFVFTPR